MTRVNIFEHNGKEIILVDFSDADEKKAVEIMEEGSKAIRSKPEGSLLTLTNVKNTRYNSETVKMMTDFVKGNKPHVKAAAVIGLSNIKKVILNALNQAAGRNIRAFSDEKEALNWLSMQK